MKIENVKRILVVGAGTMGHQIGFLCAIHGFEVVIYDLQQVMLDKAQKRIDALADRLIHKGRLQAALKETVMERITYTDDKQEASREIDIITESIPEDPQMKGNIFKEFHELCPERTIFTTNTSTLIPSMFAEFTGRPEKFLAFHFHDIVKTDVVDIMPHPGTSQETIDLVNAFAEKLGQIVIMVKKENFGYVFNAMLVDLMKSALTLAAKKVASIEDIDRAWMGIMGTDVGPFGIMDSIGLDTVWKINDNFAQLTQKQRLIDNAAFVKTYVDQGKVGLKSGEGFYSYPDPCYKRTDFIRK